MHSFIHSFIHSLFAIYTTFYNARWTLGLVFVIAYARGQLSINFKSIFKVFTKLPESRRYESNLENFENTSEINQACRLSLKNKLAVARGKACYSSKQNTASSIHPKQFLYKQNLSNVILFTCFAKLATA